MLCRVITTAAATTATTTSTSASAYQTNETRLLNVLRTRLRTLSDTTLRPVRNSSSSVNVRLGMSLYYILGMNDKSQVLTTKMQKQMVSQSSFTVASIIHQ